MYRRSFVKLTAFMLGGTSLNISAIAAVHGKYNQKLAGIFFDHGVLAAHLPDGSWNLWVRAALRGKAPANSTNIKLQVATDQNFDQIVYTKGLTAYRKNSYTVRTNFLPSQYTSLLYFRFVWDPSSAEKNSIASDPTIKQEPSNVGTMPPWSK